MRPSCKRMPTKLCMMVEAGADHPRVPALSFQFSAMGRLTREPPCRIFFQTVSNQTQTLSFPFDVTSLPARFSQSVRREPFRIFSDLVIIPFLSGLIEVLLHERCIPHQNSQCLFWASVCVCVSPVCVCVRVCLRVYIYMCKHVSLPVSVFERLSAYLCVFVFFTSSLQHTLSVSCN